MKPSTPLARGHLVAGAHAVLGLEVDEHVGVAEALADGVLQLVGGAVRVLEAGPVAELDVQVDVAPRAGLTASQLGEPDDPARASERKP